MFATKLKRQIARVRRLVVRIPRDLAAGAVEVILLRVTDKATKRRARSGTAHPAFGIWAKRTDIADAASFAAQLRQRVETRTDGNA
ncbi:MAG: hypothetical protein AB1817_22525 [Chloroflexota bacterium]